jgi:hypothetical protein
VHLLSMRAGLRQNVFVGLTMHHRITVESGITATKFAHWLSSHIESLVGNATERSGTWHWLPVAAFEGGGERPKTPALCALSGGPGGPGACKGCLPIRHLGDALIWVSSLPLV